MEVKKYNQGIDILKFIAAISIVLFHYVDHGVTDLTKAGISANWILMGVLKCGGG